MDGIVKSVDISQNLSLAMPPLPVIAQRACEHSGHDDRDGGYAWAQQHGLPLTSNDMTVATAQCPIGQQQRLALTPEGDQPAIRLLLSTMDYLHRGRNRTLSLLG